MKKNLILLLLIFAAISCKERSAGTIPFLGINSHGKIIHHYVSHFVAKKMASTLSDSSEEIIEGLENVAIAPRNLWSLSRITVGLKLEAGVDVLEAAKLESEAVVEMRFEPMANN